MCVCFCLHKNLSLVGISFLFFEVLLGEALVPKLAQILVGWEREVRATFWIISTKAEGFVFDGNFIKILLYTADVLFRGLNHVI